MHSKKIFIKNFAVNMKLFSIIKIIFIKKHFLNVDFHNPIKDLLQNPEYKKILDEEININKRICHDNISFPRLLRVFFVYILFNNQWTNGTNIINNVLYFFISHGFVIFSQDFSCLFDCHHFLRNGCIITSSIELQ